MKYIVTTFALIALLLCSCHHSDSTGTVTAEMVREGVNNYCNSHYDWSVAWDNPFIMFLTMWEETDSGYKVVFSSCAGARVYFYVDKAGGKTRVVEHVPALDVDSVVGIINLFNYLNREN